MRQSNLRQRNLRHSNLRHSNMLQSKLRQMKEAQERRVANIRQPSRQGSRPTTSQKKGAGASGSTVKSASTSLY